MNRDSTPEYRLRVAYAKQGRGAYLSHLEVIRALERMVRRAGLPYSSTQGFSPHMRISFGPALGVGVASQCEHFDVILLAYVDANDALRRLQAAAPEVLPVRECAYVSPHEPSLSAAVTIFTYQVILEGEPVRTTEVASTIELEQKGKTKSFDTLETLPEGITVVTGDSACVVTFTIRATPRGTLRPDSLIAYLTRDNPGQIDAIRSMVYTRTATYIEDEEGNWRAPIV